MTPPLSTLSLTNVTVNGQSLGTVALVFGAGGLTQFSNTNGTVQVKLPTKTELTNIGRLELTTFTNPAALEAIGNNLFQPTAATGQELV